MIYSYISPCKQKVKNILSSGIVLRSSVFLLSLWSFVFFFCLFYIDLNLLSWNWIMILALLFPLYYPIETRYFKEPSMGTNTEDKVDSVIVKK